MKFCLFLSAMCFAGTLLAQDVSPSAKKHYTDEEGRLYWNKKSPVYLRISDTPEGEGELLESKVSADYTNPFYFDTEGVNYIRTRFAVDKETKKPVRPETEILWEIYADGSAPETQITLSGAKTHKDGNTVYYGEGLSASIAAQDKISGVENTYYAINGGNYTPYSTPISFSESGAFSVKYYSTDKVGNDETPHERKFVIDAHPPKTYYNIDGIAEGRIIGLNSRIYLTQEDSLSGVAKTFYRFNEGDYKAYNGRNLPFSHLEDGEHTLDFYSLDKVGNQEAVQSFSFYFDKSAPIIAADILGDRFIANDQIYFSGRTKLKLTAVDNKSGVKDVLYSVDNEEFKSYTEPFYLPSVSGLHIIRYYSVDNMANQSEGEKSARYQEFQHNASKIHLDLTGPSLFYKYEGKTFTTRDTVFIGPHTKIKLSATDSESGLQYISYALNGAIEETKYAQPFSIEENGTHKVEFFGYDNVNNRNIKEFNLSVDASPPEIIVNFSTLPVGKKESVDIYPTFVMIFLAATDKETGSDKIYYKLNEGTKKTYVGIIQGFKKGKRYTLEITALDKLGNEAVKKVDFYIEE